MSLFIREEFVSRVLIAGEWYKVKPHTFSLDAYEFIQNWHVHPQEGEKFTAVQLDGDTTGFSFETKLVLDFVEIVGSVKSIQAIEYSRKLATDTTRRETRLMKKEVQHEV